MNVSPLRIIVAASGEYALPSLRAVSRSGHRIVQVFSQPDRPAGRGRVLTPTPVASFAAECNLLLVRTADINAETFPPADMMLVIAFGQKIAPELVSHPRLGSINLHASLLPRYRGAAPINWAILRGETVTGNTVIRLADRMDGGAILGQAELRIGELETAGELHDRLADAGAELVIDVLEKVADSTAVEIAQDEGAATLAPKLARECGRIDWSRRAWEVASQVRALYPWPCCRVRVVDEGGLDRGHLGLVRARMGVPVAGEPGVIGVEGLVAAGDGIGVDLVEVQPEGKRPMSLGAYRNGHPWGHGMRLESL